MLKRLYIKNFTLIDLLDMEFETGFSVITGETGAGKRITLGTKGGHKIHQARYRQMRHRGSFQLGKIQDERVFRTK